MVTNDYPSHDQLVHIDWHTSGLLANGSGSARAGYYGVSGVPDVYFDGVNHVVGAGDSVSMYNIYRPIVDNHYLSDGSNLIMSGQLDLDPGTMTGNVIIDLEVAPGETVGNPEFCTVRAALYEDDISTFPAAEPGTGNTRWNYIGRAMLVETALTASLSGETQHVSQSFALNAAWNIGNLHAVVFVQRNSNRKVLQAAYAIPQYDVDLADLDPPVVSTTATSTDFRSQLTYNGGTDDDVTVSIDESALPAGWDADIIWNSTTYPSSVVIPAMSLGQVEDLTVRVTPSGPAVGTVSLSARPVSNPADHVSAFSTYSVFFRTPSILFVDDDGGATSETQFEAAILDAGYFSLTYDGNPPLAYLENFDVVIWNTGELPTQTIGSGIQSILQSYLDGGGRFFLTSQGYLNHQGLTTFTTSYLRVSAFTSNVGGDNVVGVAGDPIGDGLSFTLSPPFTNAADAVTPGAGASAWLRTSPASNNVGVRYDSGVFRTVFMTEPFEGLSTADGALLMERVLDWLAPNVQTDVRPLPGAAGRLVLSQNAPNPFQGATTVRFAVPAAGPVGLTVYDVAGRKVVDLVNRPLERGAHSVVWDGRDTGGSRVASGVYLVRLTAGGETLSREMVRIE